MTEYLLTPPSTVESFGQYDRINDPLWRWMRADVALSLVKIDGIWQTARLSSYPDLDVLEGYYQGGHTYTVDQATADELIADGFMDALVEIEGDPEPQGYDDQVLGLSPLIYYKMDDVDPATAILDSSGNSRDATSVDASNSTGSAIRSGVDRSLSASVGVGACAYSGGDLGISGDFTVEVWFQNPGTNDGLFSDSSAYLLVYGGGNPSFEATLGSTGYGLGTELFILYNADGDPYQIVTDTAVESDNNIHYLVCRCTGGVLEVWIDGVAHGGFPFPGDFDSITSVYISSRGNPSFATLFSSFALYDTFMSEADIAAHYEAGQIV